MGVAEGGSGDDPEKVFEETRYIFVRLNVLREYLERELEMPNLNFKYDFDRAIDDWVFMCFFVGECVEAPWIDSHCWIWGGYFLSHFLSFKLSSCIFFDITFSFLVFFHPFVGECVEEPWIDSHCWIYGGYFLSYFPSFILSSCIV